MSGINLFDLKSGKNGKAPVIRLNSGYEMPIIGLGTYSLHGSTCTRSASVSCYYIRETDAFLKKVTTPPALIQNEIHPYYQDTDVVRHIQSLPQKIAVQSWYPLGGRGYTGPMLNNKIIGEIAERHGKSPAQVILRWDLQNGVVVIPGSSNPEHIRENISIFDFELTTEEMKEIAGLNRNEKHDWY